MKQFILLALIAIALGSTALGQAKKMSVKDYFLAIPTEFMQAAPAKRAAWIESQWAEEGYLSFNIPIKELTGDEGEGKVWGSVQVFDKTGGGVVIGMATNMCEEGACQGQLLFLNYSGGKFTDASEIAPQPENDEIIKVLRAAPAFDDKKSLKDGKEVMLYMSFSGSDKVVNFIAGGTDGDGGVVAKMYKWNGKAFVEFEYEEGPE